MPRIDIPDGLAPLQQVDQLAPGLRGPMKELRRATLDDSGLAITDIEVIRVRSAQLNGCQTCLNYRVLRDDPKRAAGAEQRLSDGFYLAITGDGDPAPLTERELLIREFTERFVTDHFSLDGDEVFWARLKTHFSDEALVELALTVASFSMSARFNHVLGVDAVCEIDWPGRTAPRACARA
jgi:alkylhydroperoxidase family enzyme